MMNNDIIVWALLVSALAYSTGERYHALQVRLRPIHKDLPKLLLSNWRVFYSYKTYFYILILILIKYQPTTSTTKIICASNEKHHF